MMKIIRIILIFIFLVTAGRIELSAQDTPVVTDTTHAKSSSHEQSGAVVKAEGGRQVERVHTTDSALQKKHSPKVAIAQRFYIDENIKKKRVNLHAEKIDFLNMKKLAFVISFAVATLLCMSVQNGFSQNAGQAKCDGEDMVIQKTNSKGDTSKTTLRVPEFDDGISDVYAYLAEHVQYPESLEGQRAEGTCTVQFLVGADGSISQVKVAHTSGYKEMDEEAVRVSSGCH